MRSNSYFVALAIIEVFAVICSDISHAHPSAHSNINGESRSIDADFTASLEEHREFDKQQEQNQKRGQPLQKYKENQSNLNYSTTLKRGSTSTSVPSITSPSTLSSPQEAYVYKAEIPSPINQGANRLVNTVKAGATSKPVASLSASGTSNNNNNINSEKDNDFSKKIIGSSVVTSVSVVLNGDEPEFTDALGQKVPKPQASLQVASPIDLLNPDRYEFYTFDDHGELVKRLMTMEEIQSIVANGDGEGPTIIHHAPIEDRDPEKNVQDIVDSVQSVLNKEVESKKNTSSDGLPIFDTPDVSSSWSMILPAIFGNTGNVDIIPQQVAQQIFMTPDTEIIETSTIESITTTTAKSKPNKKNPGQKRKPTATTTQMTPQVIQEELDSQESVYTGMQQYQNLAATMQNYNGFSQFHGQPIYHKQSDVEASTQSGVLSNQGLKKKPTTTIQNYSAALNESLAKKPAHVQQKPMQPHRVKKPNGSHTSTKRPQTNKQKIKRKPTTTTIPTTTTTTAEPTTVATTTTTAEPTITTTTTTTTTQMPTTTTSAITSPSPPSTVALTTKAPKKKKKKPTAHPVHTISTIPDDLTQRPHLIAEKRKPSSKPHRQRPKPTKSHTKYPHITSESDLATAATVRHNISHNKFQEGSHITQAKPNKFISTTSTSTTTSTTMSSSPIQIPSTESPINNFTNLQEHPEHPPFIKDHENNTRTTTRKPTSVTSVNFAAVSGTSGYPVPSHSISTEEPVFPDFSQSFTLKPYEHDSHTLESLDRIMQTLKQPEEAAENTVGIISGFVSENNEQPVNTHNYMKLQSASPLEPFHDKYDGGPSTILVDFESTSNLPNYEKTTPSDEIQKSNMKTIARPQHTLAAKMPEQIIKDNQATKVRNKNAESTNKLSISNKNPETDNFSSDMQKEQSTEQFIIKQEGEPQTEQNESPAEATTSHIFEYSTLENEYETDTDQSRISDNTQQLNTETRTPITLSQTEAGVEKIKDHTNHSIVVANVKPQLNMKVVKPSEQISMSDFQTQAATVASTLLDHIGTSPAQYSTINFNESRDEIAFLMSDVIPQISNSYAISNRHKINSNDNRYSNEAQLDLSFLMNPTTMDTQQTTSTLPNLEDEPDILQNCEFNCERHEGTQAVTYQNEDFKEESTTYYSTTGIPKDTTIIETENHEFSTESIERQPYTTQTEEIDSDSNDFFKSNLTKNDPFQNNGEDSKKSSIEKLVKKDEYVLVPDDALEENITTPQAITESITTLKGPIASVTVEYQQNQMLQNERDSLFEADAPIDTTTLINEETTPFNIVEIATSNFIKQQTDSNQDESKDAYNNTASDADPETHYITTDHDVDISNQKDEVYAQLTTLWENSAKEDTTLKAERTTESAETTTTTYHVSEETSAGLNAMISEEEETSESVEEDPYIKLGETTTLKPEYEIETSMEEKEKVSAMLQSTKATQSVMQNNVPTEEQPVTSLENYTTLQPYEESDEEDEEDQYGSHLSKLPNNLSTPLSNNMATTTTTTTPKPKITTTPRLNTLKPVSYFNKQPAYALSQDPVEPFFPKQPSQSLYTQKIENSPYQVATYSYQQRPMKRPEQLSNLMIVSTQATRPPFKLEPPPSNSKGLEASLTNLDEDILAFAKLCNELAFSYWKAITAEKISSARSLIISPFALTSMLSMVFLGARGSTSGEMNDVLKLDDMVTFNPHLVFKNITDSVEKTADPNIATTAFVRELYSDRANGKVLQFFKEKAQQLYAGHVEEVNFHVVNDIIRRRTNLLVKRHTMGKVLEYLRTNSVWVNGPLATISANLFQTDCTHGSTHIRDGEIFFQVHPTVRQRRLVPIPAVLFKYGFTAGYEPNLDATVVAFGENQDTTSVIYVMPGHLRSISPTDKLDRLEKQLMDTAISKNSWSNLLTSLMNRPGLEVQIPRFSHRSFINATLGLQKMGLKGLFKSDYADLGGLTGSSNRDIYLSDIIQINTFSTCGEEKIADHHHVEMYPAPPLRKRNKDVDVRGDDDQDSSEDIIDFGSIVQDSVLGRGFYDDLLDPKYLELPLPLRPRQARVPDAPRLKFDKPFLYFVRHNPSGMILFMGRFNPRLLP